MRLGEIASSPKYQMDEQFQNSLICLTKFWFFKLEKEIYKFVNFQNCKT